MPSVPNVEGQPKKVMIQPPVDLDGEQAPSPTIKPVPKQAEPKPEPPAPLPIPKSQDQLAEESINQQNIRKRNEMIPATLPIDKIVNQPPVKRYEFTDADRKAAIAASKDDKYDWEETGLDEALTHLASIRAECERGGIVLQRRTSEAKVERVKCFACDNIINISEGRWAGMRTRNNFETGLPESEYACSARCSIILNRDFSHPTTRPSITAVG